MNIPEVISLGVAVILSLCAFAIFLSVAISFVESRANHQVKREAKSFVETGSMLCFFVIYYLMIKNSIGYIQLSTGYVHLLVSLIGTTIVVFGTYVNIRGRWELGQNWANQIKIYQDHQLMQTGMFALVRHPLYGSLIWIFIAGSFIFSNIVALLLAIFIFLPFMYYRAKQEESILIKVFPQEYEKYQLHVPMLFPKMIQ